MGRGKGGGRDDTAANNLDIRCSQPNGDGSHWLRGDGRTWGSWGRNIFCPSGTAVCGIATQVEGREGRY